MMNKIVNRTAAAALSILTMAAIARAESPATQPNFLAPAGLAEVVRLWPNDPPATSLFDKEDNVMRRGNPATPSYGVKPGRMPSLAVFLPPNATAPLSAVIVCPGGGYAFEQASSEGQDIARALAARGIAAFLLKYRLPNQKTPLASELPVPQQDVLRAIQIVRERADHWKIDPKRIGVMGFSAGGHLAATAATMYDDAKLFAGVVHDDATSKQSARPDFAVLVYPVITMEKATHGGSRQLLLGKEASPEVLARFSAEQHVTPQTPPLFIVVAEDDGTVPAINSHMMSDAAQTAGIPHELLTYPHGGHGFGLGAKGKTFGWFDQALAWLEKQGAIDAVSH